MAIIKKILKNNFKNKKINRKYLFIIPFFFTFANAALGFISVLYAIEGNLLFAAYSIILAMLMDGFDGRTARYFNVQSAIGGELDSLSDAISFCFAPMIMIYSWRCFSISKAPIFLLVLYLLLLGLVFLNTVFLLILISYRLINFENIIFSFNANCLIMICNYI
jgi:phosphatidylserine synthase